MRAATPGVLHIEASRAINGQRFINTEEGKTIATAEETFAAYIAHACNAYPRLVKALERVLDITQHEPIGSLGNALSAIARAALASAKEEA